MKCKEKGCGGTVEVSPDKAVSLQTGCGGGGCDVPRSDAYPCNKCGSLHYDNGSLVATRGGANVFLIGRSLFGKKVNPSAPLGDQISIEPL